MSKIIYVEDDPDTAETVKTVLSMAGLKIDIAKTGKEGLKMILQGDYDLALIDIGLPDISGWQLFQEAKHKKTKFVFITALPVTDERMTEVEKAGISGFIPKPFDNKKLVATVKKLLKK